MGSATPIKGTYGKHNNSAERGLERVGAFVSYDVFNKSALLYDDEGDTAQAHDYQGFLREW